jgi:hypothetical protein
MYRLRQQDREMAKKMNRKGKKVLIVFIERV